MNRARIRQIGTLVLVADAVIGTTAAEAKTKVRLSLPPEADANTGIPFSFTASGLKGRTRLVLQRQMGTKKRYGTIVKLTPAVTSGTLPALGLGRYGFRIAALRTKRKHHHTRTKLVASQAASLTVYGPVPFSTLFPSAGRGTYTTPRSTFSFIGEYASGKKVITVSRSSNRCRSIHFDFVPGDTDTDYYASTSTVGTITLVQESRDPQSASARYDEFGALDATLRPGESWSLLTSATDPTIGRPYVRFPVNGSASCYSDKPFR